MGPGGREQDIWQTGAVEALAEERYQSTSDAKVQGKRYVDFPRCCLHYHLTVSEPESYEVLLSYEKLNMVSKTKIGGRERRKLKNMEKLKDLKGYMYEWWIREAKEENKDESGSKSSWQHERNVRDLQPDQAIDTKWEAVRKVLIIATHSYVCRNINQFVEG